MRAMKEYPKFGKNLTGTCQWSDGSLIGTKKLKYRTGIQILYTGTVQL